MFFKQRNRHIANSWLTVYRDNDEVLKRYCQSIFTSVRIFSLGIRIINIEIWHRFVTLDRRIHIARFDKPSCLWQIRIYDKWVFYYLLNFPYIGHINYNLNVSHFELFFSLLILLWPDFDQNWTKTEDGLLHDLNWYLILFDYCVRI